MRGKIYFGICICFVLLSCSKKDSNSCDKWLVMYWQGTASGTTLTDEYRPYQKDVDVCGGDKATVYKDKQVIISQEGVDRFNYMTYEAKH